MMTWFFIVWEHSDLLPECSSVENHYWAESMFFGLSTGINHSRWKKKKKEKKKESKQGNPSSHKW